MKQSEKTPRERGLEKVTREQAMKILRERGPCYSSTWSGYASMLHSLGYEVMEPKFKVQRLKDDFFVKHLHGCSIYRLESRVETETANFLVAAGAVTCTDRYKDTILDWCCEGVNRLLLLEYARKNDPDKIISLDIYDLILVRDGPTFNDQTYDGINARITEAKLKPMADDEIVISYLHSNGDCFREFKFDLCKDYRTRVVEQKSTTD